MWLQILVSSLLFSTVHCFYISQTDSIDLPLPSSTPSATSSIAYNTTDSFNGTRLGNGTHFNGTGYSSQSNSSVALSTVSLTSISLSSSPISLLSDVVSVALSTASLTSISLSSSPIALLSDVVSDADPTSSGSSSSKSSASRTEHVTTEKPSSQTLYATVAPTPASDTINSIDNESVDISTAKTEEGSSSSSRASLPTSESTHIETRKATTSSRVEVESTTIRVTSTQDRKSSSLHSEEPTASETSTELVMETFSSDLDASSTSSSKHPLTTSNIRPTQTNSLSEDDSTSLKDTSSTKRHDSTTEVKLSSSPSTSNVRSTTLNPAQMSSTVFPETSVTLTRTIPSSIKTCKLPPIFTPNSAPLKCNHDNCFRQFIQSSSAVAGFCATYTKCVNTEATGLPDFVSQCSSVPSKISSACTCVDTGVASASTSEQAPVSTSTSNPVKATTSSISAARTKPSTLVVYMTSTIIPSRFSTRPSPSSSQLEARTSATTTWKIDATSSRGEMSTSGPRSSSKLEARTSSTIYSTTLSPSSSSSSMATSTSIVKSFNTITMLSLTTTKLSIPLYVPPVCNHNGNNCYRQVLKTSALAAPFCATYTTTINTATTSLPAFVSNCDSPSEVSSVCSCIFTPSPPFPPLSTSIKASTNKLTSSSIPVSSSSSATTTWKIDRTSSKIELSTPGPKPSSKTAALAASSSIGSSRRFEPTNMKTTMITTTKTIALLPLPPTTLGSISSVSRLGNTTTAGFNPQPTSGNFTIEDKNGTGSATTASFNTTSGVFDLPSETPEIPRVVDAEPPPPDHVPGKADFGVL